MAKSVKVILTLVDRDGFEWVDVETTESKAKKIVKAYMSADILLSARIREVA